LFATEVVDGKEFTNFNWLQFQSPNVQQISDIPNFLFAMQSDHQPNGRRFTKDEFKLIVERLRDLVVSVPYIPPVEAHLWNEYEVALARTPHKMATYARKIVHIFREKDKKVWLLAHGEAFDYLHLERTFLHDICNHYTRERDVVLGRTITGVPYLFETFHMTRRVGYKLVLSNPAYLGADVAAAQKEFGLKIDRQNAAIIVDTDPEEFFSGYYFERHNLSHNEFLPAKVDAKLWEHYATSPHLQGTLRRAMKRFYPQDFHRKSYTEADLLAKREMPEADDPTPLQDEEEQPGPAKRTKPRLEDFD
jgi:hypothetical protein